MTVRSTTIVMMPEFRVLDLAVTIVLCLGHFSSLQVQGEAVVSRQPWLTPCGRGVDLSARCRVNTSVVHHYTVHTDDINTLLQVVRAARWIEKSAKALRDDLLREFTNGEWEKQRYRPCMVPLLDNKSKSLVLMRSFKCLMRQSVKMQFLKVTLNATQSQVQLGDNYVQRVHNLLHDTQRGLVTTLCTVESYLSRVRVCLPPPHRRYVIMRSRDVNADDNEANGGKVKCKRCLIVKQMLVDLDKTRSVAKDVRLTIKSLLKHYTH